HSTSHWRSPSGCGPIKTGRRCCRRVEGCPNVPSALTTVEAARALGWETRRGLGKDLSSMTRRRTIVTAAILAGALGLTACGTKLASDPNVVGVVGTLNSSTSQTVAPILAGKNIVQISPANTNPTLTLGDNPVQSPKRPFPTYFRTATTDLVQGPFGAQYLVQ